MKTKTKEFIVDIAVSVLGAVFFIFCVGLTTVLLLKSFS